MRERQSETERREEKGQDFKKCKRERWGRQRVRGTKTGEGKEEG